MNDDNHDNREPLSMIVTQLTRDGEPPLVVDESMDTPGRRKEEIENEKEGKKVKS